MASSKQKGNIAPFLLFVSLVFFAIILVLGAVYMFPDGIKSGKYVNPNVATRVLQGSVFDRNGRTLSAEIANFDNGGKIVSFTRTYPSTFHACHLVNEAVVCLAPYINPRPGFDEAITYGSNVYLTIDLDIQYVLDLATQMVYTEYDCSNSIGFIADAKTGEILAISNYPFFNLNEITSIGINKALVSSINVNGQYLKTSVVSKIVDHNNSTVYSNSPGNDTNFGFTTDLENTRALINSGNVVYKLIPNESDPQYVLFVGAFDCSQNINKTEIVDLITNGLSAQKKI